MFWIFVALREYRSIDSVDGIEVFFCFELAVHRPYLIHRLGGKFKLIRRRFDVRSFRFTIYSASARHSLHIQFSV